VPADYFLDTSALAKRYVAEAGSAWVMALTDPASGNASWLAAVTRVELIAALSLRVRVGTLTPAEAQQAEQLFRHELVTHYQLVPILDGILDEAMRLVVLHPLRAYDAVQLAAALYVQGQYGPSGLGLTFVAADRRLLRAAAAVGLLIEDPNNYP
jgi:predicted nucleic acid-binding protein